MMKVNYKHLLIKAHYFFFMGSLGSTAPFVQVCGKQLGVSPLIMGSIAAIIPVLGLIAKPIFGFIMDYFQTWRKMIFIILIIITNSGYIATFFLPALSDLTQSDLHFQNVSCTSLPHCDMEYHALAIASCNGTKDATCHWACEDINFTTSLSFHGIERKAIISSNTTCLLNINETSQCQENIILNYNCYVSCVNFKNDHCWYTSITFWAFAILMSLSEIGYYVSVSITDAICFGILGQSEQCRFGGQRLWGTIGFGVTACLAGYMIDLWSQREEVYKMYMSLFLLVLILTCIDLVCCRKLKLAFDSRSSTILKDVFALLKLKSIIIFLCFATFVGVLNSITRHFLFWYLEDVAIATGYMDRIKLIEGLIVAAQTFGGEIIFFFLSGKILKKLGYGYTFTFCFVCYALRLGLMSLVPTPWWVLPIEFFMHGSSYALSLITVVGYANIVTPPGTLATVQGIVQGVSDCFGITIGSLIGGIFYKKFGGRITLRIFSVFAAFSALMYFILHIMYLRHKITDTRINIKWEKPEDAQRHCVVADT